MTGIITRNFRIHNAKQFEESFDETEPSKIYVGVGRSYSWDDDNNPPTEVETVSNTTYDVWRPLYAAKKIMPNDVSFVIPRYNWTSGTVYQEYRSNDSSHYGNKFYVITDNRNVYKCLFNNNGAQSTVEPTGTSTSNINTADGYIWKFMYTVTAGESLKFLTQNFMPVKTLESDDGSAQWQVQSTASNGSIEVVDVLTGGTNYVRNAGTLSSVANSKVMFLSNSASTLDNIYNFSSLYIDGGLGAGQIDEIIDYIGSSREVVLKNGFTITPNSSSTYSVAPTITINGDGSSATAYANVASGAVSKITVIDSGENYSYGSVDITANSTNGSGATALPYISPYGGHGSNPLYELNGHNVLINTKFENDEANTIPSNTEIRLITLITDPLNSNGTVANSVNYDLSTTLNLSSINGTFSVDEVIDGLTSDTTARVLQYANTTTSTGYIKLTDVRDEFQVSETVSGNTSTATATVDSVVQPELTVYSGEVIYIDNRTPIERTTDQTEDIKLIIKF